MRDDARRLESRLADIRQALSEARSADVRTFLRDLLETYERALEELDPSTPTARRVGEEA